MANSMKTRVNKWLFLVTSIMVTMLEFGLIFSFGAVFVALLDTYQRDRSTTATVQSLLIGVTLIFGLVSGTLITTLGLPVVTLSSAILVPLGFFASFFATSIEYLYVSIGIISGTGISMGYFSAITVIGRVFTGRQKMMFLAVLTASNAVAGIIYPYFIDWLLKSYGLKGTFLILSAVLCNGFVLFILCLVNKDALSTAESQVTASNANKIKDQPQQIVTKSQLDNQTLNKDAGETFSSKAHDCVTNGFHRLLQLMSKPYIFLLFAQLASLTGLNAYIGLILDIAREKGLLEAQGLSSFIFFNIANIFARLMPGLLKQRSGINSLTFPIFSSLSGCTGNLIIYFGDSYATYAIGTSLIGISVGGNISAVVVVAVKILRPELVPVGTGLLFTVTGITTVGTGSIFGWIKDKTGSYSIVILTVAALQGIGTIFYIMAMVSRRHPKEEKKNNPEVPDSRTVFTITVTKM